MNERGVIISTIIVFTVALIGCVDRKDSTGGDTARPEEITPVIVIPLRSTFLLSDGDVANRIRLALDNGDLAKAQQGLNSEDRLQPGETFVVRVDAQSEDRALVFVIPTNRRSNGKRLQFLVLVNGEGRALGSIKAVGIPQQ